MTGLLGVLSVKKSRVMHTPTTVRHPTVQPGQLRVSDDINDEINHNGSRRAWQLMTE